MPIIVEAILVIALLGLLAWFVTTYIPMPDPFKKAIYVICVIALLFYFLALFGWLPGNAIHGHGLLSRSR